MRPGGEDVASRAPSHTCLVTIHGPELGNRIDLFDGLTIGRGLECNVVVPLSEVSRCHCRILQTADGFVVRDLGSTNGTWLNEQRLPENGERRLAHGDELKLGSVIYRVLDGDDVEMQYNDELYRIAIVDGLTQVYNRRYLTEFLEREMARAQRYSREVSLLLFEVDHFKRISDDLGRPVADKVLRELALAVGSGVRQECCFARLGGEGFAVVLPETSLAEARVVAERVRRLVEDEEFTSEGRRIPVSVSIGIAVIDPAMDGAGALFQRAHERAQQARQQGGNRVVG